MGHNKYDSVDKVKDKKVLKKIAELNALGLSPTNISDKINEEFGFRPDPPTVKGVIRQYTVTGTQFLETEKDIANLFNESLRELLGEAKKNMKILSKLRDDLSEAMERVQIKDLLDGDQGKAFKEYMREVKDTIGYLDRSMSSFKGILDLVDKQKKEVTMSATQSTQMIMDQLEELEESGLIVISPKLKERKKNASSA